MIFGFSVKNCLKISYYIFDLENITGQCHQTLLFNGYNIAAVYLQLPPFATMYKKLCREQMFLK